MLGILDKTAMLTFKNKPTYCGAHSRVFRRPDGSFLQELVVVIRRNGELGFWSSHQWNPMSEDNSDWIED